MSLSDLLTNIRSFVSLFHRTRSEKKTYFKSLLKRIYSNGTYYLQEYNNVVNQHSLVSTGGVYKCGARYLYDGTWYNTRIYYWTPSNYHNNQKASIYFVNGSNTKTTSNQGLGSTYVNVFSHKTLSYTQSGKVTVTIPAYHDTTNNVYYSGVKYSITFSGLTTSIVYYDITFEQ